MRLRPVRTAHRIPALALAAVLVAAVTFSGTGASAQNLESLRARADRLADELERLEQRASRLDEEYLQLGEDLAELEAERAAKQQAVAAARAEVDEARRQAAGYVVEAYIDAGSSDRLVLRSSDVNTAVNHRTLLELVRGDRELLADELDVRRQDLDARVAELDAAERELEERRTRQQAVVEEIDSAVEEHRGLLAGANAELRRAIDAERRRREAEAAEAAERQRAAEAARARSTHRQAAATTTTSERTRGAAPSSTAPSTARRSDPAPEPSRLPPVSAPNGRAAGAIAAARSVLGTPYRWAGTSPSTGFDCSGLLVWAWAKVGVSLPRTSRAMYAGTQRISASQLQPGDLVFYGSPVYHVGMYVGGGQMIHSPQTGDVVKISSIHRGGGGPVGYGRIG